MKKLVSLFLLLIVLAVSGCSTVPVKTGEIERGEYQNAAIIIVFAGIELNYTVAPQLIRAGKHMAEKDIVSCLENRIKKHNPDQSFISYYQFANTMFDLEVRRELETYSKLLADDKFYQDVLSYGVRYLIFVRGSISETNEFDMYWDAPSFPPIFLGYESRDHKTRLTASILDLHQKETVIDDLENISEGTSWVAGLLFIPIWHSSYAESNACEDMGNRLGKILLDRSKQ